MANAAARRAEPRPGRSVTISRAWRRLVGEIIASLRADTRVRVSRLGSRKRARAPSATTISVRLCCGSILGATGSCALRLGFITDLVIDRLLEQLARH
jgi:hypothetical protein